MKWNHKSMTVDPDRSKCNKKAKLYYMLHEEPEDVRISKKKRKERQLATKPESAYLQE